MACAIARHVQLQGMWKTQTRAIHMAKQLTKQPLFGVPSLEMASKIDDSDKIEGLRAAHYRYSARMRELEVQFESKASELRVAYLREVAEIQGNEAAEEHQ